MLLEQLAVPKYYHVAAVTYFQLRITIIILLHKLDLNRKCHEVLFREIIVHQFHYNVSLLML